MFNDAQAEIFERYKHPLHGGTLPGADLIKTGANPVCGDELRLFVKLNQAGEIAQITHESRACAICTAAADFLAEDALGKTIAQTGEIAPQEIEKRIGIPLSPIRLKCALLPLETLKQA